MPLTGGVEDAVTVKLPPADKDALIEYLKTL